MSLIAVCVHSTEANDRLKYTKQSIASLIETVDLSKHRVFIINNASSKEAKEFLSGYKDLFTIIHLSENIGTARGINLVLAQRLPSEVCYKSDDDVVWHSKGWVEEIEQVFKERPDIGICGLKRSDVWQTIDHPNPEYRTHMEGDLEICDDIIGTCTGFNPDLLDKIGFMSQPSQYSFDDVIFSVRSIVAGFKNAFLPHIEITHIDDGLNPYCEWKKREAGIYIQEASIYMNMIKEGKLSYYYDGGFDD